MPAAARNPSLPIATIDMGNTRLHCGFVHQGQVTDMEHFPTSAFEEPLQAWLQTRPSAGIAWCSVVPQRSPALAAIAQKHQGYVHHLTWDNSPGLPIAYPNPAEIGEDRLANAIAAQIIGQGAPAVVLDAGTAVTYDLITPESGYLGGFIAPGLALMTDYLHEKTAQLPQVPLDALNKEQPFGRSTRESMALACAVGFTGMISALTARVLQEMERLGHPSPLMLATGGSTRHLLPEPERWAYHPTLTLLGLAEAWRRGAAQ